MGQLTPDQPTVNCCGTDELMTVKISIIITSFNHEKYIAQGLESVLSQKGDFRMEIIIGDDCSTDNTRSIAQEFQDKYPEIISLLPNEPNLGITKNLKRCLDACSGDYIAICEGDDYWTDIYKLEKQKDFLEAHLDYSMCFSAIMIYFEDKNRFEPHYDQLLFDKDILTTEDLIKQNHIGNFSCCMYRTSIVRQLPAGIFDIFTVDWMFNIACSRIGKIGFIRDWMSVYRKHPQGAWAGKEELGKLKELRHLIDVYNEFFNYEHDGAFSKYANIVDNEIIRFQRKTKETRLVVVLPAAKNIIMVWNRIKEKLRPFARRARVIKDVLLSWHYQFLEKLIKPAQTEKVELIIVDTVFPHPLSPFRRQEFTSYLNHFPNSLVLSNGEHFQLLKESKSLAIIIAEFEQENPHLKNRVRATTRKIDRYDAKLAYVTFLFNIDAFLDAFEKKNIPFVFTLYPGGAFAINNAASDHRLQRVFASPQFRKVIVTQKVTYNYLIDKQFCSPSQVEFIYGVVTPLLSTNNNANKHHFGFDKKNLDVCFVAYKYMEHGIDKGYDIFIGVAKKLAQRYENVRFHIVGGFTKSDLPVEELGNKIVFYGLQKPEWFEEFYLDKDIILSPNRPFKLGDGYFDGFPTASCTDAGIRQVAMFCTDKLHLNIKFIDGNDIVIIPPDPEKIVETISYYYLHPEKLRSLAQNGASRIRDVYSHENQMTPRIKILESELKKG
jgi:glycosyltransferase involved in cell wall biosynthesis